MAICLAIPPLTIGLFAGAYVDRADRRRIMLASDLLRAIVVLGFVLVGSADRLWLLFLFAFVQSSIGTFFAPARGAVIPKVVPREGLLAANSVAQATRVVAGIVGAGLARADHRRRRGVLAGVRARRAVVPRLVRPDPRPARGRRPDQRARRTPPRPPPTRSPSPTPAPSPGIFASLTLGLSRVAHSRLLSTTIALARRRHARPGRGQRPVRAADHRRPRGQPGVVRRRSTWPRARR